MGFAFQAEEENANLSEQHCPLRNDLLGKWNCIIKPQSSYNCSSYFFYDSLGMSGWWPKESKFQSLATGRDLCSNDLKHQ